MMKPNGSEMQLTFMKSLIFNHFSYDRNSKRQIHINFNRKKKHDVGMSWERNLTDTR